MADAPAPTPTTNADTDARAEALSWLASRYRWERLLADLHEIAEREAAPVVELPHNQPSPRKDTSAA